MAGGFQRGARSPGRSRRRLLAAILAWTVAPAFGEPVLVDRVVAVVDGDPILLSDVRRVIDLGLVAADEDETATALERRVLDGLIEQRLRLHAVDRYGLGEVAADRVDEQLAALEAQLGGAAALDQRLLELSFDRAGLRLLLSRQLQLESFVEDRLGARVFVGLDAIREHYETRLRPQLEAMGDTVAPLEEVREQIRRVLREQRLLVEIERWTEELRREADIVDHLRRETRPLPPVLPDDTPVAGGGTSMAHPGRALGRASAASSG